jgi:hypothetical protein
MSGGDLSGVQPLPEIEHTSGVAGRNRRWQSVGQQGEHVPFTNETVDQQNR